MRARSDVAKWKRRKAILVEANQLLRIDGIDAFTMNKLAKACGLAKGTLYLYFATREELVLTLYTDLNEAWMERFLVRERACAIADYDAFCCRFYQSFIADNLLAEFAAQVASMLEPNVPQTAWIAAKQSQAKIAKRLGGMFCQKFECKPATAQRLAWSFLAGLSGAQQRAIALDGRTDMPDDLQKLSGVISCREVFLHIVLPLAPNADTANALGSRSPNDE